MGKGTVTYIGMDSEDGVFEKQVLQKVYTLAGATTEDYPKGVFVYWRDGFNIAVNYSSADYQLVIPASARILVGEKTLKPAGVTVWKE
jgi:beta-galactosidase